jgi:hypothetical protein
MCACVCVSDMHLCVTYVCVTCASICRNVYACEGRNEGNKE